MTVKHPLSRLSLNHNQIQFYQLEEKYLTLLNHHGEVMSNIYDLFSS